MKKRSIFAATTAIAMVASITAPIATEAAAQNKQTITIKNVKVLNPEQIEVTYVKNNTTYTKKLEPYKPVKHNSTFVQLKIDGQKKSFRLSTPFINPGYIEYRDALKGMNKALTELDFSSLESHHAVAYKYEKTMKLEYLATPTLEALERLALKIKQKTSEVNKNASYILYKYEAFEKIDVPAGTTPQQLVDKLPSTITAYTYDNDTPVTIKINWDTKPLFDKDILESGNAYTISGTLDLSQHSQYIDAIRTVTFSANVN